MAAVAGGAVADAPSAPRPAQQPSAAAADPRCFRRAVRHRQALQRWRPFGARPAPVLAAITLVGRCRRRAAVDAVPASGAVGRVHEGTW